MPSKEVNPNLDIKAGPKRWIAHLCGILFFQCVLYGSIAASVYWIVTLNWQMMIAIAVQVLLQSFLTMSPTYVRLVQKYIYPLWYFKRFQRIYDEPEFEEEHTMFCFHPHSVFSYCTIFVTIRHCFPASRGWKPDVEDGGAWQSLHTKSSHIQCDT